MKKLLYLIDPKKISEELTLSSEQSKNLIDLIRMAQILLQEKYRKDMSREDSIDSNNLIEEKIMLFSKES